MPPMQKPQMYSRKARASTLDDKNMETNESGSRSHNIPVAELEELAAVFNKDIVLLFAWTQARNELNSVCYGSSELHMVKAKDWLMRGIHLYGGDLRSAVFYEEHWSKREVELEAKLKFLTAKISTLAQLRDASGINIRSFAIDTLEALSTIIK
jgi:hypothetical protein